MSAASLEKLLSTGSLERDELRAVLSNMLSGRLNPSQIAGFLTLWHYLGEDRYLLSEGAKLLRDQAQTSDFSARLGNDFVDNCGTGGSGKKKFNISTAAAILAASTGIKVIKHGNRSASGQCGSADLLEKAGFPLDLPSTRLESLFVKTGLAFLFAPNFHPSLKPLAPIRKALGIRTVFNLLGPLANPLRPNRQLIGVGSKKLLGPMVEALIDLGIEKALVVHSEDGFDEISPVSRTDAVLIEAKKISSFSIDPKKMGCKEFDKDTSGGNAKENIQILERVLNNVASTQREACILNAAALLWLAEHSSSMEDGVHHLRKQLESGACSTFFRNWIKLARNEP